jgi:hypothetical protein
MEDLMIMVGLVVGRAALERAATWLFAAKPAAARWGLRLSLGGALLLELERTTP